MVLPHLELAAAIVAESVVEDGEARREALAEVLTQVELARQAGYPLSGLTDMIRACALALRGEAD